MRNEQLKFLRRIKEGLKYLALAKHIKGQSDLYKKPDRAQKPLIILVCDELFSTLQHLTHRSDDACLSLPYDYFNV